ncbi:MAG: matrixin family metalloprotease [Polyangiaceae bacterium]
MSALLSRGRKALFAALAVIAGGTFLAPETAHAYCRSSSCAEKEEAGRFCEPAATDNCGIPLFWNRPCVGFNLQRDASEQVTLAQAESTFKKAFATWMGAACNGGHPAIRLEYTGAVECSTVEYNSGDGKNANIIMFRDREWPHSGAGVLALTIVTFSRSSGEIYDADMEVNTADNEFVMTDKEPALDLLSVATHEAGHFLGLSHSPDEDATMFATYVPGTVGQRTLSDDDVHGVCDAYPPGTLASEACDTTPRHGFSSLCGVDQGKAGSGGDGAGASSGDGGSGADEETPEGGAPGSASSANACSSSAAPGEDSGSVLPEIGILVLGYLLLKRRSSADPKTDVRFRRLAQRGTELRRSSPTLRRLSADFRRLSRRHPW